MRGWLRCFLRGSHDPRRQLVGGFRCADCGVPGKDLDDYVHGTGYVNPARPIYDRAKRTITRDGFAS